VRHRLEEITMTTTEMELPKMPASVNAARVEAFAGRMVRALNDGALALMVSLGHRAGLFDAMDGQAPATSVQIAGRAGLEERYVREWLGAMVTSRVIDFDPDTDRYVLPPEHAACLTRASSPDNLAVFAQYIALLGTVEDDVLAAFRRGGGVPYERYGRFHEVMAEDSGQTVLPVLIDAILPLAPGLVARLEEGIDVLDVGCGSGRALNLLAERFPASRFTGIDFSAQAVRRAKSEARRKDLDNVQFLVRDVAAMDDDGTFDLVTAFDAVHDQADPAGLLRNVRRALAPDGIFLMQDIGASSHVHENIEHPIGTLLYTISTMHCMTVSLAQGGDGLGTCWGRQTALRMLDDAGFGDVEVHDLPHDVQNCYYVARP
jgi:SAM-dependent methyltransferase